MPELVFLDMVRQRKSLVPVRYLTETDQSVVIMTELRQHTDMVKGHGGNACYLKPT
jgi:hypothetical protein